MGSSVSVGHMLTLFLITSDINVEHLQLLLFLLHGLPLMQKKSMLLQLAQNIARVVETYKTR